MASTFIEYMGREWKDEDGSVIKVYVGGEVQMGML